MTLAIIGGTGLTSIDGLQLVRREVVGTPYGEPSGPIVHGLLHDHPVLFLPRHGRGHTIPPHQINYRANLWALRELGVTAVIAVAAVGGITAAMQPARVVIPDQLIDYTWGRESSFFGEGAVTHVDFTDPYDPALRQCLSDAARLCIGEEAVAHGVYGATQGPRLETAAEIRRMARDGCDLVGMTGMPEAVLARELGIRYACCAVVANRAAGLAEGPITMAEIEQQLVLGMERVRRVLALALPRAGERNT
jgi:5'-methylthioinosine phosphorylase